MGVNSGVTHPTNRHSTATVDNRRHGLGIRASMTPPGAVGLHYGKNGKMDSRLHETPYAPSQPSGVSLQPPLSLELLADRIFGAANGANNMVAGLGENVIRGAEEASKGAIRALPNRRNRGAHGRIDGVNGGRHRGPRHPDSQHPDRRHPKSRHPDSRHMTGRRSGNARYGGTHDGTFGNNNGNPRMQSGLEPPHLLHEIGVDARYGGISPGTVHTPHGRGIKRRDGARPRSQPPPTYPATHPSLHHQRSTDSFGVGEEYREDERYDSDAGYGEEANYYEPDLPLSHPPSSYHGAQPLQHQGAHGGIRRGTGHAGSLSQTQQREHPLNGIDRNAAYDGRLGGSIDANTGWEPESPQSYREFRIHSPSGSEGTELEHERQMRMMGPGSGMFPAPGGGQPYYDHPYGGNSQPAHGRNRQPGRMRTPVNGQNAY